MCEHSTTVTSSARLVDAVGVKADDDDEAPVARGLGHVGAVGGRRQLEGGGALEPVAVGERRPEPLRVAAVADDAPGRRGPRDVRYEGLEERAPPAAARRRRDDGKVVEEDGRELGIGWDVGFLRASARWRRSHVRRRDDLDAVRNARPHSSVALHHDVAPRPAALDRRAGEAEPVADFEDVSAGVISSASTSASM